MLIKPLLHLMSLKYFTFSTDMATLYEETCTMLSWPVDSQLLAKMKSNNEEKLKQLDAAIEDAETNLGEMEVREANLRKAEFLCRIGDKVTILLTKPFLKFGP